MLQIARKILHKGILFRTSHQHELKKCIKHGFYTARQKHIESADKLARIQTEP